MVIANVPQWSLDTSTTLSGYYVKNMVAPRDVLKTLLADGIAPILVGAHALAMWMEEPRATQDVDVVVASKLVKKAVRSLLTAYKHLQADDQEVVVRLRDKETEKVLIDVIKPIEPLMRALFKNTKAVQEKGLEYRIPTLEMALALKFAPMVSLTRQDAKKYQDAHDFILLVKQNAAIDLAKLAELGELVYSSGGKEVCENVRRVRAGEKLTL